MKNRSQNYTILLLAFVLLFSALCLSGCSSYKSKYKAVAFVHNNTAESAFMTFYSFDGTMVFKLKNNSGSDSRLLYSAKLENGSAAVSYDISGTKADLYTIGSGEELESELTLPDKGTVYIIVKTDGECLNGDFRFNIK